LQKHPQDYWHRGGDTGVHNIDFAFLVASAFGI